MRCAWHLITVTGDARRIFKCGAGHGIKLWLTPVALAAFCLLSDPVTAIGELLAMATVASSSRPLGELQGECYKSLSRCNCRADKSYLRNWPITINMKFLLPHPLPFLLLCGLYRSSLDLPVSQNFWTLNSHIWKYPVPFYSYPSFIKEMTFLYGTFRNISPTDIYHLHVILFSSLALNVPHIRFWFFPLTALWRRMTMSLFSLACGISRLYAEMKTHKNPFLRWLVNIFFVLHTQIVWATNFGNSRQGKQLFMRSIIYCLLLLFFCPWTWDQKLL